MLKNWQTTLAGVLTLLGLGFKVYSHGFDSSTDLPAATAALGLIRAKDLSVRDPEPASVKRGENPAVQS